MTRHGRAPIIGLTTYLEEARWGVWTAPAALLPASYVRAVAACGGVPVLLPPVTPDAGAVLERIDGLVLTGGCDVDPARYGQRPHPRTSAPQVERDGWEISLAEIALHDGLPLLAVCRGMQVLNVARGGSLTQHLPDGVGHADHAPAPGQFGTHRVRTAEGSTLHGILGGEVDVPTYHHQAVDELGRDLVAVGWAEDGTVEAVEVRGRPAVLGVQWHPEEGKDLRLFADIVQRASATQTGRTTSSQ